MTDKLSHGPLRLTDPKVRVNDDLELNSREWTLLNRYGPNYQYVTYRHPEITGDSKDADTMFNVKFFDKCLVYIITETVADYPYTYFTEKTWKAIVSKSPFMIVGARYSLKKLQEFGFKTFDTWWDETYDLQARPTERIEQMVLELTRLSKLDNSTLNQMKKEMQQVTEFNYHHLKTFTKNDLANIQSKL